MTKTLAERNAPFTQWVRVSTTSDGFTNALRVPGGAVLLTVALGVPTKVFVPMEKKSREKWLGELEAQNKKEGVTWS